MIVAGKQPALQDLSMDDAILHCTLGVSIWDWASNDERDPEVVLACAGDVATLETVAAAALLREHLPACACARSTSSISRACSQSHSTRTACPMRDTVEKIFGHPASGNVEWRQVLSLLEDIGTVTTEHNGKLKVSLGPETELLRTPHGKDVDVQMVVDLRRMLTQAGLAPDGTPASPDERSRDHGDGQWGEPT